MSKHIHPHHHHHQADTSTSPENIQTKTAGDDSSLQRRAYEIHREKGGGALDNWLEAERSLNK